MSYHVFVGPYLEVHNPVRPIIKQRPSCPNPKCNLHKKKADSKFCPQCGTKNEPTDYESTGKTEFNICDEFKTERLTELRFEGMPKACKDYMYFHSNIDSGAGRTLSDDSEFIPMDVRTPINETNVFETLFAEEIQRIKEVFGEDRVKIKWGVIAYWH